MHGQIRPELKDLLVARIMNVTTRKKDRNVTLKLKSSSGDVTVKCHEDIVNKLCLKPLSQYLWKVPIRWCLPAERAKILRSGGPEIDGIVTHPVKFLTTLYEMKCLIKDG